MVVWCVLALVSLSDMQMNRNLPDHQACADAAETEILRVCTLGCIRHMLDHLFAAPETPSLTAKTFEYRLGDHASSRADGCCSCRAPAGCDQVLAGDLCCPNITTRPKLVNQATQEAVKTPASSPSAMMSWHCAHALDSDW